MLIQFITGTLGRSHYTGECECMCTFARGWTSLHGCFSFAPRQVSGDAESSENVPVPFVLGAKGKHGRELSLIPFSSLI